MQLDKENTSFQFFYNDECRHQKLEEKMQELENKGYKTFIMPTSGSHALWVSDKRWKSFYEVVGTNSIIDYLNRMVLN